MVKSTQADFVDSHGFSSRRDLSVAQSVTSAIVRGRFVTYKHVSILANSEDDDLDSFAINLSPVRALALVKRLLSQLDAMAREGVEIPPLYSSFMDDFIKVDDLDKMNSDYDDFVGRLRDSVIVPDGVELKDILPPALT